MIILGLGNGTTSGAALIKDNKIVAAVNEERFTRIKMHRIFPKNSIDYVLKESGIGIDEINIITCGGWKGMDEEKILPKFSQKIMESVMKNPDSYKIIMDRIEACHRRDRDVREEMRNEMRKLGGEKKLVYVDHHTCHIYSAFYLSPFKEALVVTSDGRGDWKSITVSLASVDDGIKDLDVYTPFDSLGAYYGIITQALGFTPNKHEGKVTGLAAHGDPNKCMPLMQKMISFKDGRISSNIGDYYSPFFSASPPKLIGEIKKYKMEDVAAACQEWLEYLIINYLKPFVKEYKIKNICLSGGTFANVRVNQKIREMEGVENVYVDPNMSDGGLVVGSALYELYRNNEIIKRPLKNVYLGPEYSNEEIEKILKENKIPYQEIKDKTKLTVDLIEKGKILGWFQGRMEYGPRALGARSILAEATDIKINDWLNKRLHRTEFMPFAPVTIEEKSKEYYIGWNPDHLCSKFMTMCYSCTDKIKKETPAVVHIDNTARPQIVNENDNAEYYRVVREYYKRTGRGSLVNTSFNNHEEPIICSPQNAVDSLKRNNVDVVVIGDFIIGL